MKKLLVLLLCAMFISIAYAGENDYEKKTSINCGLSLPLGDFSDQNSLGVFVGDVSKWYVSNSFSFLGRIECQYFDGKTKTETYGYGEYSYTLTTYTSPSLIVAVGSGVECHLSSRNNPYIDIDFPSIGLTFFNGGQGVLRTGFGIGFGYEFAVEKSTFGLELKFNSYVVNGDPPLQFVNAGVKVSI